ncbi:Tenascin-X, partial [Spheniscus humboldti]
SQPRLGELTASQITSDSVQLEWSVPEGTFDSFTVQYRDAQGKPESLLVAGGSRTVSVPGLSPSHRYNFYLYGVLGPKRVGPVSLDTITGEGLCRVCPCPVWALGLEPPQEEKPPTQPRLGELTASRVAPDSVQLEWSVPEGTFDSFTVQYKDAQGQPQALPVAGGSRTVSVPGLSPSRRYKFNLYGVWGRKRVGPVSIDAVTGDNICVPLGPWFWAAAEPEEEPPTQPRLGELTASRVAPDSVQLEWSVPEGTFDSFTVQYKDAQGQPQALPVAGGSRTVSVP